ncbi:hypothetical protein LZ32DRAFT_125445 [Colletotrichum eremochloae]|nr:hypothetical protein LZ32DRAFT_125445 [Colletotrichum eremochloae]
MASDHDIATASEEAQRPDFLERLRDHLNNDHGSFMTPTTNMSGPELRALKQFVKLMEECDGDEARIARMSTNLALSLGQTPAMDVYLEDYEAKMAILTFIANTPFVQVKGEPARKIDSGRLSRFTWAAIWLNPLETMQKWQQTIEAQEPFDFPGMIQGVMYTLPVLAKIWRGKHDSANRQSRPSRKDAPKQTALRRDKSCCVLIGSEDPEVAHIYPHASITSATECSLATESLMKLWGDLPIRQFMKKMNMQHIDVAENMISLNCLIHFWMDQFKIALEPVEELSDNQTLALRFRRLRDSKLRPVKGQKSKYDITGLELNQDPKEILEDLKTSTGELLGFYARNVKTGEPIEDGHLFYVRTNDPIERPLPSIHIMQIYYRMALMMRLAGAAEEEDDDDNPPDPPEEGAATPVSQGTRYEDSD